MSIDISDELKVCIHCETLLSLKNYEFRKDTGKYRNTCKKCVCRQVLDRKLGVKKPEESQELKDKKAQNKKLRKAASAKKYREKSKDKVREAKKLYYENNKEAIEVKRKIYYLQNAEKISVTRAAWKNRNKGAVSNYTRARQLKKLRAMPFWADTVKIKAIYERAIRFENWLDTKFHVDHIIPLNHPLVCGLHNEFNLQILTKEENLLKSNKFNPDNFSFVLKRGHRNAN